MDLDQQMTRRKAIILIATAGAGGVSLGAYLLSNDDQSRGGDGLPSPGQGQSTPENTPSTPGPGSQDEKETSTPLRPDAIDIRDVGAAVDGKTNDASAFMRAVERAAPDGTVVLPPGTLVVDGGDHKEAVRLAGQYDDLLIMGTGASPEETKVEIMSGQEQRHVAFGIGTTGGDQLGKLTLANLTIDGNAANQRSAGGFGIFATGDDGTLILQDCIVRNTVNAGIRFSGGIESDIRHCAFFDCGDPDVSAGHAINPNQNEEVTVNIERCLFQNSAGADIDVGDDTEADYQTVNIDSCFFEMGLSGIKLDPGNKITRITNTRMVGGDRTGKAIKANNEGFNCGSLELENLVVENIGGPAVDIGSQDFDDLLLDDVLVRNIENEGMRNSGENNTAAGIYAERSTFRSLGSVSIHDVGPDNEGDAVWFRRDCSGNIAELIHSGTRRLGQTDGVTIDRVSTEREPLELDVITRDEVGPRDPPPVLKQ